MLEIPEVTAHDGWDDKKKFDFEHAQAIVSRAMAAEVDLTDKLGSDWTLLGFVFSIFGDAGKDLFTTLSEKSGATPVQIAEKWKFCTDKNKLKGISKLLTIAKMNNIDTTVPNVEDRDPVKFIPRDADASASADFETYGFFSKNNQYWMLIKSGEFGYKPKAFTNFTMRVLFHIDDAKKPRRLIEITNMKNRRRTVDVTTDKLTSEGKFKEFIEGLGNYLWEGSAVQLSRLKRKLFEEEKDCMQLEQLGWTHDNYYAFCNGILYADEFIPVDDNGIVHIGDTSVYIPSGNKLYSRQHFMFQAEKKFRFHENDLNFETWARLFYASYGGPGMLALSYNLACVFSDIIYKAVKGFPMLYFYGEGGSGKGSIIKSCQCLYGDPQSPLTLTGKANTDKAKIRKFAQFVNSMMLLEEFSNSLSIDSIMMLRALWDRMGYERSVLESKFGTENVPINSGVGITGNDYPIDDPLLQRLLIVEMNKNQFTDESRENWRRLIACEDKGISGVLFEILKHRDYFNDEFALMMSDVSKDIDKQIFGVNCTERMIRNLSAVLTTMKLLSAKLTFPFNYNQALEYGCAALIKQNEKRGNAGEVQKYFDCLVWLIKNGKVAAGREFKLNGSELHLRFAEVYPEFAMAHAQIYRTAPLGKNSMKDKLMMSEYWIGYKDKERFGNSVTSCYVFSNSKLADSGANILSAMDAARDLENKYKKEKSAPDVPEVDAMLAIMDRKGDGAPF